MKDFRLKTVDGSPLRNDSLGRTYFVINAAKYAVENDLEPETYFSYGSSSETLFLNALSADSVTITRNKTNETFTFSIVAKGSTTTETKKDSENELVTKIADLIKSASTNTSESVDIDEVTANVLSNITPEVANMIKEQTKNLVCKHEITVNALPTVKIDGTLHPAFNEVLMLASSREPVYLFGPAGSGKNVLSEQVAKALNLNFYYAGTLQQKYELEGFVNAAGVYQETDFYRAFVNGGVFLFDEIDGASPEVLIAFNAAMANRYYNFPGIGRVVAHPDFIIIAAGNTNGMGATNQYNGRCKIDDSTRDRFAFCKLDYNKEIELSILGGDNDLYNMFVAIRKAVKEQDLTYTVSPRSMKRFMLCRANNLSLSDCWRLAIVGGWDSNDANLILSSIQKTEEASNKYFSGFESACFGLI